VHPGAYHEPDPARDLAAYFLAQQDRGRKVGIPHGYSRGQVLTQDATLLSLRHNATGVVVWSEALQVCPEDCRRPTLLYLYTKCSAFVSIIEAKGDWREWLTKTWTKDGVISMTALPPDKFSSKQAILENIYVNHEDAEEKQRILTKFKGNADYCLPFIVPRKDAFDAMREHVPGVARGPGYNRKGESIRNDRDIWVVNLLSDVPKREVSIPDRTNTFRSVSTQGERPERSNTLRSNVSIPERSNTNRSVTPERSNTLMSSTCAPDEPVVIMEPRKGPEGLKQLQSPRTALRKVEVNPEHTIAQRLAITRALRQIDDDNPGQRKNAVECLGKYAKPNDGDLIKALEKRSQDKDGSVRLAALQALFKTTLRMQDDPKTALEVDDAFISYHIEGRRQHVAPMERPSSLELPHHHDAGCAPGGCEQACSSHAEHSSSWNPFSSYLQHWACFAAACEVQEGVPVRSSTDQHEFNLVEQVPFSEQVPGLNSEITTQADPASHREFHVATSVESMYQ
jgi:hypothetical protein